MNKIYLLIILLALPLVHSAQDRAALEAQRMDVLKEIEKLEIKLQGIDNEKTEIYREISSLEKSTASSEGVVRRSHSARKQIQKKTIQPEVERSTEPAEFTDGDEEMYATLNALQQEILNRQSRNLQIAKHKGKYNEDAEFISSKMILARHESQINKVLTDRSRKSSAQEVMVEEEFTKEEIPLSAAFEQEHFPADTEEILESTDISHLLEQTTELTDASGRIKLKIASLTSEWEELNQQIEYAMTGGKTVINIGRLDGVDDVVMPPSIIAVPNEVVSAPDATTSSYGMTSGFSARKGFLAWPMKDAILVGRYGQQQHKTIPNINVDNKGIDLRSIESEVSSIFSGTVEKVTAISGLQTIVVEHAGKYFTVYSGLLNATVSAGDAVEQGTYLGHAAGNEMHFEIWDNDKNQNPSHWLKNN